LCRPRVDPTSYFRWKKKFGFLKSRPIPGKPSRFSKEQALAIIKQAEKIGSKGVREKYGINQCAVSRFACGKSSVIKRTLEMQSEDTSAARDPLKEACLARGVWVNS
jgi:hypothetical protein